ncbi:alpha/beta fold hydrolase [Rhodococcus sp. CH91]|uniref:alpha/beta fold hydrolase n=1 Tax=Rhodococcus sp. CH91 TaxID=2910256 RepID=UPI001F4B0822|nr:alpha/beta fold hydrolase [Rhodococcus sp. CH91]
MPASGKVHVHESGAGDRTVLLLHGFSDHGGTWCKVAPGIAEHHRVLTVDLPGFGRSAQHWRTPVLDHYVDVVADLVADLSQPVSLVGNSLGAVTALVFASVHPSRVDRVVLADMPGLAGIPRLWTRGARVPVELSRALLRPLPAPVVQRAVGALYARAAVHRRGTFDPAVRTAFAANYATRGQVDTLLSVGRHAIGELGRLPIPEMVHALDMPALLLWGARDRLTPARAARRVNVGDRRRVVILPDAGHCPQLDAPREFLDAVLPFLA